MIEPIEMNVDFSTQDTEMNVEADMNCKVETPLPIASATTLGGIKVGENLSITEDGTLSADANADDVEQLKNALITDSASGSIASFPDGGDGFAVRDLKVQMEPIQAGSGDPSPTNIRPISGRTGVTVTRTGKNLFGGTFNEFFPLHFESDKTVIASADAVSSGTPQMGFYDENKVRIDYWGMDSAHSSVSGRVARVIELPKESYYVKFIGNESTRYMIELGNTNTTFESYVGNTYNITFPSEAGTVYGGTLDVTQGVLTVDRALVDLGTLAWQKENTVTGKWRFYAGFTAHKRTTGAEIPNMKCSAYPTVTGNQTWQGLNGISNNGQSPSITLCDLNYSDVSTFQTAMNGVQLCYELANPVTVQLTAQQITTLLGQNNVWSDADSVSVDYVADTKLYITKVIADALS